MAASAKETAFESMAAIFAVRDLPEALAFYTDTLGFDVGWTWGDPPTYASVCRGNVELNLGLPARGEAPRTSSVYIGVTNVDAFHAGVVAGGATVTVPIGDRDYGMRDFTLVDPSGNQLCFGQPTAG